MRCKTFSSHRRLTRTLSFQEAYKQNHKWVGTFMVMWRRSAPDSALRLGVVAGKKVGNAVARNRAKRRLRELFRIHRCHLKTRDDLVLTARRKIVCAPWAEVENEFLNLCQRSRILSK